MIETDALDVIDFRLLGKDFAFPLKYGWWEKLAHGLMLTSLFAPLTFVRKIDHVLIASSATKQSFEPWGSDKVSDEKIKWSGTNVIHDSYDLSRAGKVKEILAPYVKLQHEQFIPLRVCTGKLSARLKSQTLNCGRCEKCRRSMVGLLIEGIDPSCKGRSGVPLIMTREISLSLFRMREVVESMPPVYRRRYL